MDSPSQLDKEDEDFEPMDEEDDDDYKPGKKKKPKKKKKPPQKAAAQKPSQFQFVAEIPIEFDVEPSSKAEKRPDKKDESLPSTDPAEDNQCDTTTKEDQPATPKEGNSQEPLKKKPRKMITPQRNRNETKRIFPMNPPAAEETSNNVATEKDPLALTTSDVNQQPTPAPVTTAVNRFPCGFCDTVFTDISFLDRHHKRCKAKRTAESINLAQRGFINLPKALPPYTPSTTGRFMYSCDKCSFSTKNAEHLKFHRPIHNDEQYFSCNQCKFSCRDLQQLEKHKVLHLKSAEYANLQGVKMDNDATSNVAKDDSLTNAIGGTPFKEDASVTSNTGSPNDFPNVKQEEGTIMYSCDQCSYSTSRQGYLIMHKKIHVRDQPYQCVDCGYKCSRLAYFKKHRATHGVMDDTLVSCDRCSFTTSSQNVLDAHKLCHKA